MPSAGVKTAAVIGPNGNLSQSMAGYYGPTAVCGNAFPSMIDAVKSYLPAATVSYMPGVSSVLSVWKRSSTPLSAPFLLL